MQDSIFYLIDKNLIKKNIEETKADMPLNLNSIIDGRCEFYGLGNDIVSTVEKCNIDYVLVNDIKEALNLRKYNDSINIIIKYLDKDYVFDAIVNNIILTIYSYKELEDLINLDIKDDYNVFLYINDEIEGFNNLNRIESYLKENNHLKILGVYTEFNSKKTDNKKYETFKSTISFLSNDIIQFIISDNQYNLNTNYYSKNVYIKDINEIISLQGNLKYVKKFVKNDTVLNKKIKSNKTFGIINMPYEVLVKKVFIKDRIYKLIDIYNNKLIVECNENIKVKTQVEILGKKSKNDITSYIKINNIPKYYLSGSTIEKEKFY